MASHDDDSRFVFDPEGDVFLILPSIVEVEDVEACEDEELEKEHADKPSETGVELSEGPKEEAKENPDQETSDEPKKESHPHEPGASEPSEDELNDTTVLNETENSTTHEVTGSSDNNEWSSTASSRISARKYITKDERMQVSAKHLVLASSVFKKLLSGKSPVDTEVLARSKNEIPLPDDNFEAFEIVLNIIHGRSRRVPRVVDLQLLTEIATLVYKYDLLEAVETFSDAWIQKLSSTIPRGVDDDLLPWLSISWAFEKESIFKSLTAAAQRKSSQELVTSLPIPDKLFALIEESRQTAIAGLCKVLQDLIEKYHQPETVCRTRMDERSRFQCDGFILGVILKSCSKMDLSPFPEPPYNGFSVDSLVSQMLSFRLESLCQLKYRLPPNYHDKIHPLCESPGDSIRDAVKVIEACLDGLKLENFPKLV